MQCREEKTHFLGWKEGQRERSGAVEANGNFRVIHSHVLSSSLEAENQGSLTNIAKVSLGDNLKIKTEKGTLVITNILQS